MKESELLKERLQAITEKHRIQEVIRHKKQELDQEKLKLKHLKKKSLREQWLLDTSSHNAPGSSSSSEQQTRSLLLSIYRIEKEIEALEREEAIVSKNESFILEQLRAVEKSTQDIIKEANDSFVPEPPPVATATPHFPQPLTPTTNVPVLPDAPQRKTLFAMEINVNKNSRTGESTVLSTSSLHPDHLHTHPGLKVYDDGRKCVYALEGSDESCVSELSASEVEQLLKSATMHRQKNMQLNGHDHYCHQPQSHHPAPLYSRHTGLFHPRDGTHPGEEEEESWRGSYLHCNGQRQGKKSGRDIQRGTSFKLPQNNNHYPSHQLRRHQSFHCNGHSHYRNNHSNHANGYALNRANRCPSPRSHDQEVVSAHQLCYTPASDIPLSDYISVDEEEELPHYRLSPSPHRISPAPSPVFGEDTAYTILSAIETGEPITAVFMGFQPAQDDMGRGQGFEGALKAELVIIDDDYGKEKAESRREKEEPGRNGSVGGAKERRAGRRVGPGMRKLQEKHCCSLS